MRGAMKTSGGWTLAPEDVRLGSESFNELTFADPAGLRVRVLEARTFSPPPQVHPALTGRFDALSWPVADPDAVADFWQRLHVDTDPATGDWAALRADIGGQSVAWHSPRISIEPLLVFRHPDLPGLRTQLAAAEVPAGRSVGFTTPHLVLGSPEGQKLAILA